jgi:hypothetical protein
MCCRFALTLVRSMKTGSTGITGVARVALRAGIAYACGTGRALRTGRTDVAAIALRAGRAGRALRAGRTGVALHALRAGRAGRALTDGRLTCDRFSDAKRRRARLGAVETLVVKHRFPRVGRLAASRWSARPLKIPMNPRSINSSAISVSIARMRHSWPRPVITTSPMLQFGTMVISAGGSLGSPSSSLSKKRNIRARLP